MYHEVVQQDMSQIVSDTYDIIFLRSDDMATFFAAHFGTAAIQGQLLFKDGIYFFGKPAGINDAWISYI